MASLQSFQIMVQLFRRRNKAITLEENGQPRGQLEILLNVWGMGNFCLLNYLKAIVRTSFLLSFTYLKQLSLDILSGSLLFQRSGFGRIGCKFLTRQLGDLFMGGLFPVHYYHEIKVCLSHMEETLKSTLRNTFTAIKNRKRFYCKTKVQTAFILQNYKSERLIYQSYVYTVVKCIMYILYYIIYFVCSRLPAAGDRQPERD